MKIASLFAGAAAIALIASSAQAGEIHRGQYQLFGSTQNVGITNTGIGFVDAIARGYADANLANAGGVLGPISDTFSAWHAYGNSTGDNGTAESSDHAQFTLKGKVNTDCALYSGSSQSHTLDFGTLGIYASDNTGPANAFDMVDDATVSIYTNLAGCNTANNVVLSKNSVQGLVNTGNTGGFDTNVFQKNLPFKVVANYTAGTDGVEEAGSPQTLTADVGDLSATRAHGAWKSPLALHVTIPAPTASLLAGDYSGWVRVEISAQ
ncbi:hypothetical protein [uncultured Brevundimonas sp.]|uniref:hypothetical protein n=1 Tax=uncultured Brevundimonas sp. TaxID=213418 RepID=UPI00261E7AE7|nr:hypothetical protein [uncultured Brevundimonas sp.]